MPQVTQHPQLSQVKTYIAENIPEPVEKILENSRVQIHPLDRDAGHHRGHNEGGKKNFPIFAHAKAGQKAKSNPHTAQAITHLKQTVQDGKQVDSQSASSDAKTALMHLHDAD